ncbi:MAG: rhomboid family intramembrane serine protease [Vicingaceae bacterium]
MFRRVTPVVKNLLIINGLFYLAMISLSNLGIDLAEYLGLHYWKSPDFKPHQLITYAFMHSYDPMHILFNMFAVWMFGIVLEQVWGGKRFLIYYLITAIGAAIVQLLVIHLRIVQLTDGLPPEAIAYILNDGRDALLQGKNFIDPVMANLNLLYHSTTVGASGAVFGILLAFGMLFPNTQLMLLFPPIPIKAKYFVIGYAIIELYMGFVNANDNVAHFAHLGGMLFGYILIKYWQKHTSNFY